MNIKTIFILMIGNLSYLYAQNGDSTRYSTEPSVCILTNYNGSPSSETKAGWNLIFKDAFDGTVLNTNKWNVTGPDDDFPGLANGTVWGNPANVSVNGGACHLKLTNQPTRSQGNNFKPYSGSEIKTFTEVNNTALNYYYDDFHYGFGVDTYIEMRVKLPGGRGAGSSGWLYQPWAPTGHYREYDIWETYGMYKPKQFVNTFIYEKPGYRDNSLSRKEIETGNGAYIDMDWYVFGLERTAQGYITYINGASG
jgi:hypothetical protein